MIRSHSVYILPFFISVTTLFLSFFIVRSNHHPQNAVAAITTSRQIRMLIKANAARLSAQTREKPSGAVSGSPLSSITPMFLASLHLQDQDSIDSLASTPPMMRGPFETCVENATTVIEAISPAIATADARKFKRSVRGWGYDKLVNSKM